MIETYAYARAALVGNPSDGYFGKTISYLVRDFRARVLVRPSARLEIVASKADTPVFDSLDELCRLTRWRGYYGGIRIIQALIVRFADYCRDQGRPLPNRNFTLEYESTIPLRLGMGGSSAIVTAALRALLEYYDRDIPLPLQANLILETETRELNVPAGLQDRVIQVYEGLVYMDFARELMEKQQHGAYERLDPALLPPVYLAYRTSLSEGTEVVHRSLRERWRAGDPVVIEAMRTWAGYAEQARAALLAGDHGALGQLIDANFDLRDSLYDVGQGNREMVLAARAAGATANFAGSGGAVTGTCRDEETFRRVQDNLRPMGVEVIRPAILPLAPA